MADRTMKAVLTADVAGYIAGMRKAGEATKSMQAGLEATGSKIKAQQALEDQRSQALAAQAEQRRAAMDRAGTQLMTIGAIGLAAFGGVVKAASDFDSAMSNVAATGAEAKAQIGELRAAALKAGADTKFSATEAAGGIEALQKAGISVADTLGGGLTGALNLAAAGEISVGNAAEITAKTLSQFNLKGKDAAHVADLLAAGAGKAVGDVHDFGEALKMSGTVAHQYGLSVEETTGTLAAFAQNALLGSDAGTSLKTMLIRLGAPTKEAQTAMDELGISAYDSQGKFRSMEDIAGQLQDKLGGLSESQRNAAMQTIFGADAMRAANILMSEGREGIAKWTAAVDDQGYAAQVAAERMNNLAGDLEQLRGSLETALIQAGSSASEGLRPLVQGLTEVVNLVGQIPAPIVTAGVSILGIGSAGALATGGMMKLVGAGLDMRDNWLELRSSSPKVAGALKSVATAGAVAAGALVALSVIKSINEMMQQAKPTTAEYIGALSKLGEGGRNAAAGLDQLAGRGNVQMLQFGDATNRTAGSFRDLMQNLNYVKDGFGAVQLWGDNLVHSLTGINFATTDTVAAFRSVDAALAGMDSKQAQAAFRELTTQAEAAGVPVSTLVEYLPQYADKIQQAANAAGVGAMGQSQLTAAMGGTQAMVGALEGPLSAYRQGVDGAAAATGQHAEKSQAAALALYEYKQGMMEAASVALGLSGSMIGLEASFDAAADAVKRNGKNLDINTEAGRANRTALDQIAASAISVQKAGGMTADVQRRTAKEFVNTAAKMGMTRVEAIQLAQSYGLIPDDVSTDIAAPGAKATKQQADEVTAALKAIPPERRPEIVSKWMSGGYDAAMAALRKVDGYNPDAVIHTRADLSGVELARQRLAALRDRTVYVRTVNSVSGGSGQVANQGRRIQDGHALGGYISGPGTGTSDSIPAWLSNGEYVIRAASTARYGADLLSRINSGTIDPALLRRAVRGYATGGEVRRYATGQATRATAPASTATPVTPPTGAVNLTIVNPVAERPSESIRAASSALVLAGGL